ncbi:23.6 kDa heat shock protein, mitochondrial-like [Oryza brachyantha]|uniref:23.6 kDa heat shock protein, mitochondrial-like n=1 Tax=Oryza brachyantha TaxID=4533 RepID=UPI001ADC366A|nr:23.6 kDa heat shock protein, mitochondrial-like [Oryza brachyantha]
MALARVCLNKALAVAGRSLAAPRPAIAAPPPAASFHALFSSAAGDTTAPAKGEGHNSREVAVVDRSRRRCPWRDLRDLVPFRLVDGIGSALSQVAGTLARPLERLAPPSWRSPAGKVREDEERYRLRFEVPGLGKDDVRVYVDDDGGVVVIHGEKHEEEEHAGDGDDEQWAASTYGVYHASLLLPEDARAEGITAEVRDGVLYVTVPRAPERKRSVTEVKVQ